MYTSGHEEILNDALRALRRSGELRLSREDRAALLKALAYPDFPCGGVNIDGGSDEVVAAMQPCSLFATASALVFSRLSLSFQSHKGLYSLWHAMTFDPDKTVSNIARNVCEYVLICCSLAWRRRSLFWLGFALHIVMDAYSPAHVMREGSAEGKFHDGDLLTWLRTHDDELDADDAKTVGVLRRVIRVVVRDVAAGRRPGEIVARQPKDLRRIAAFALFDHLQRRQLPVRVNERSLRAQQAQQSHQSRARGGGGGGTSSHRILNFYYYPRQRGVFHNMHDLLSAVKRFGVYDRCVADVRDVLRLYFAARKVEDARTDAKGSPAIYRDADQPCRSGHGAQAHKRFLQAVMRLLVRRTFAIHPQCADVETGFDVQRVLDPTYRRLRFDAAPQLGRGVFRCAERPELRVRVLGRATFVLPTVRNVATRPSVVPKTYRFTQTTTGKKGSASGSASASADKAAWLQYKLIETADGLGYPVSIQLDSGVRFEHPVLIAT